jgi:AcrR family transcriptional regulator
MNKQLTKQKPRARIITTATQLFYGHDAHTVGVDRICEVADVSKRTLYKYFPTKEALVAAAITALGDAWYEACTSSDSDDPVERITHVFKMVKPMAKKADFYGCVLMNTSIELRDSNALAKDVAKEFKDRLYNYFEQQATLLRVKDPGVLAEQLILLHDGCSAWIVMRHEFPMSTFTTLNMLLNSAVKI